ncbi:MAG TPA: FlgO family outer membrane protein [Pyrinomonadaceae bacterium]|nr:FlgO family outer membrane protein [Pyrinomonadaceae bacterium]
MKTVLLLALSCFTVIAAVVRAGPPGKTQANDTLEQRLDGLARKISDNLTENQKHTIAVVEFSDLKGNVTNFGRFLSEELITRLYLTKKFKVIERQQLNKIIAEQKLSLTGVVDPASAQKLGRVLGVDSIVFGSVSDLVKTLRINARLISTETGEVFAAASIEIVKDDAVSSLMGDSGAATGSPPRPNSSPTPASRGQRSWRIDSHFFTFDLRGCRLSGTSVMCEFIITNNDKDRGLGIGGSTVMFDDFGNEARPRAVRIADKTGGDTAYAALISGVATRARIAFEGVSPDATKMTLFHLGLYGDAGNFEIEYRNIPLRDPPSSEGGSEFADSSAASNDQSNRKATVQVAPGSQWTDSGVDVEPGMRLSVVVSGSLTAKVQNKAVSEILSGVLKQPVNVPPSNRSIGPKALLARIHYRTGGDSKTIAVGEKNTLIVEANEYGRLYFGVDNRYANSLGAFTVNLSW